MAALRKPSGRRAGSSRCRSGRLDGVSSTMMVSAGSRSASAAITCAARSGSPAAVAAGGRGRHRRDGRPRPAGRGSRAASRGRPAPERPPRPGDGAVVGVLGVVGDQRDHRAGLDQRARLERVLPEHRRAHREHEVVAGQHLPQAGPAGGEVPGELRVVLREPGAGGERLLPHRAAQPLGQRDQRRPGLGVVGVGSHHERRRRSRRRPARPARHHGRVDGRCAVQHRRRGGRDVVGGRGPVVARHDHQRRAAAARRLVPGPGHRTRHVLRARRLVTHTG